MKILFLGHKDYASSACYYARALETQGHAATIRVEVLHQFAYADHGTLLNPATIQQEIDAADAVWLIQGDLPVALGGVIPPPDFLARIEPYEKQGFQIVKYVGGTRPAPPRLAASWMRRLEKKRLIVQHGSSYYRVCPDFYTQRWNDFDVVHVMHSADLLGLGARNEHLVVPPVDFTRLAWRDPEPHATLRVGHFPTSITSKGTVPILKALQRWLRSDPAAAARLEVWHSRFDFAKPGAVVTVPWADHVKRMTWCDVVVDQIQPTCQGRPFGEWCSTALEAAALGRLVITNSHRPEAYEAVYGEWPAHVVCNTPERMVTTLQDMLRWTPEQIRAEQQATAAWAVRCHGYERTGQLLNALVMAGVPC